MMMKNPRAQHQVILGNDNLIPESSELRLTVDSINFFFLNLVSTQGKTASATKAVMYMWNTVLFVQMKSIRLEYTYRV